MFITLAKAHYRLNYKTKKKIQKQITNEINDKTFST